MSGMKNKTRHAMCAAAGLQVGAAAAATDVVALKSQRVWNQNELI